MTQVTKKSEKIENMYRTNMYVTVVLKIKKLSLEIFNSKSTVFYIFRVFGFSMIHAKYFERKNLIKLSGMRGCIINILEFFRDFYVPLTRKNGENPIIRICSVTTRLVEIEDRKLMYNIFYRYAFERSFHK